MKIKLMDRFLAALAGLLLFAAGVCAIVIGCGAVWQFVITRLFGETILLWHRAVFVGAGVILALIGMHSISLLFRRRQDKGFVYRQTEYGDMSISMKALQTMVRKCVEAHEDLAAQQIGIEKEDEGIRIALKVVVSSGNSIPEMVDSLQRQIKQYVTTCSGVEVKQVSVMVEADPDRLAPPALMAPQNLEEAVPVKETVPAETIAEEPAAEEAAVEEPVQAVEAVIEAAEAEMPEAETPAEAEWETVMPQTEPETLDEMILEEGANE